MALRALVLALAVSMAAAFTASPRVARSTVMMANNDFAGEIGTPKNTPGIAVWDPLGLLDEADEDRFNRLREVELKHGRISMLAILGHITTTAGVRLPGYLSTSADVKFSDVPSGLAAFSKLPFLGFMQIFLFVGFLELFVMKDVTGESEFIGDFRNGYIDFGWAKFDEDEKLRKREIELNNGRAAQMGILALMVHEQLNNDPYVINSLFGAPIDFNAGF